MIRFKQIQPRKQIPVATLLASPVIGSAVSAIGSLFGGKSASDVNLKATRETNAMQMKMFQQQLDYNRAAEDRARRYALEDYEMNSPAAQRARWEAAGLNPALMMGESSAGQIRESAAGSSAPSAPQLSVPVQSDYITPAMQQLVDGMIGFSQAQKNAEEAAGIASDTRVKAATEQLRIKQAYQENQRRIYELRSMKHLPKIKQMELKNLEEQNRILQDTNAMLDMTVDARSKSQRSLNYLNDAMARKADTEYRAQLIKNEFIYNHELNKLRFDEKQIDAISQTIVESMSRVKVNGEMAVKLALEAAGLKPGTAQWSRASALIKSEIVRNRSTRYQIGPFGLPANIGDKGDSNLNFGDKSYYW